MRRKRARRLDDAMNQYKIASAVSGYVHSQIYYAIEVVENWSLIKRPVYMWIKDSICVK